MCRRHRTAGNDCRECLLDQREVGHLHQHDHLFVVFGAAVSDIRKRRKGNCLFTSFVYVYNFQYTNPVCFFSSQKLRKTEISFDHLFQPEKCLALLSYRYNCFSDTICVLAIKLLIKLASVSSLSFWYISSSLIMALHTLVMFSPN